VRTRPLAVALSVLAATWLVLGGTAEAKIEHRKADGNTSGGTAQAHAGVLTLDDGQGASGGGGGGRGRPSSLTCKRYNAMWFHGTPAGSYTPERAAEESRTPLGGELKAGDPYGLICTDAAGNEVVNELRRYDPSGSAAPLVDPEVLAQEAKQDLALPLPGVQTSPPPERDQLVNLPTWLWVEDWSPRSATASVPGVSSTVTAAPRRVVWDMGNGDQVVCRGPGKPYDLSLKEHQQSSDCTYTYRASSAGQPGQRFQASATMTWSVSWTASGAPGGGDLGEVSRTTTFPMRVAEGQALVSEAG
jgi:hypothetical protein